jgi:hypothetical protein
MWMMLPSPFIPETLFAVVIEKLDLGIVDIDMAIFPTGSPGLGYRWYDLFKPRNDGWFRRHVRLLRWDRIVAAWSK